MHIPFIFAGYIINATLSSLFFKKNKVDALDTLLTIAIFGLVINGLVFAVGFIWLDLMANVTLFTMLLSLLRGLLIVAGLYFIVKVFKLLPITLISPITMVMIVPLLLLSWLIFGDIVNTIVIVLIGAILVACISLVFVEHKYQTHAKPAPSSSLGTKIVTTTSKGNLLKATRKPLLNYTNILAERFNGKLGVKSFPKEQAITKRKPSHFWAGIGFLALAMGCFLSTQIITRFLGEESKHMITITFFNSLVIFVTVMLIFVIVKRNPIKTFSINIKNPLQIGIGITDTIWLFFYVPLVLAMNLGVLNAIARISVALTVLTGVFILKEKVSPLAFPIIAVIIGLGIAIGLLM